MEAKHIHQWVACKIDLNRSRFRYTGSPR